MRNIFESVSASPRLRRFSSSYVLFYLIIMLTVNLIGKLVPVLDSFLYGYPKDLVVYFIEGALLFGLIRGISEKSYRISHSLSSFSESENYVYYFIYAAVNITYSIVFDLVSKLTAEGSALVTFGWVLTVIVNLVRFVLNFALVRLYFEKILFNAEVLDVLSVCRSVWKTIISKPLRIVAAEIVMLFARYVSVLFGTLLVSVATGMIGTHWAVSFVGSLIVSIQFGALIYTWPVYYLYYKETCEE